MAELAPEAVAATAPLPEAFAFPILGLALGRPPHEFCSPVGEPTLVLVVAISQQRVGLA